MFFNVILTKIFLPTTFVFLSSLVLYLKLQLDNIEKNQAQVVKQLEKIIFSIHENEKDIKQVLGSTKNTINVVNSGSDQFYMGITSGDIITSSINILGFICMTYFVIFCLNQIGTQIASDLKIIDSNTSNGVDIIRAEACSHTQQLVTQIVEAAQVPNQVIFDNLITIRTNLLNFDPELKALNNSSSEMQMVTLFAEYLANGTPPPFL